MELDLHIHTNYSFDCAMKPKKIVDIAKSRGLSGIAITDHNTIEGALETQKYASDGFFVIIGEEITTKAGDIVGLFLNEEIITDDPQEAISKIKSQGGIAVLSHPFVQHLSIEDNVAKKLDACEGFNARHSRTKVLNNSLGETHIVEFARQYDLSIIAGSDAHFYGEIGRARTIIPASNLEEVKDAILKGNTALVGKKSPPFSLLASGILKIIRYLLNPVPEAYTSLGKIKPTVKVESPKIEIKDVKK